MLIVDAHEDLAWNILSFGRDYILSAQQTRHGETGSLAPQVNDDTLIGWPDYQLGRVAVVFATLFASPLRGRAGFWDTQCYANDLQAHRLYSAQLDAYDRLVDQHPDKFRMLHSKSDLRRVLESWQKTPLTTKPDSQPVSPGEASGSPGEASGSPVGLAVLMEGAEAVRELGELEEWWGRGVRWIGPAWKGNRFCGGTREPGPLSRQGYALLEAMTSIGFGLDLSHMDEPAALQALDAYSGIIIASHSNALALLRGSESNRHLSDRLIHGLIERDAVIGVVLFNHFLKHGWQRGDRRDEVSLNEVVAQIDYLCQVAGDARHVGIGSDFDGGFGLQSAPEGIDSVADFQKLAPLLAVKGYSEQDIANILGLNWLNRLEKVLPDQA